MNTGAKSWDPQVGLRVALEQHVRRLEAIGHRGSATSNEALAGSLLAAELRQFGLDPVTESFASHNAYGARILVHLLVAAAGLWAVSITALGALCLTLVALGSLLIETSTRARVLSRLLPSARSCNVVARIPARGPVLAERIVLCAHIDTQRTGVVWRPGLLRMATRALAIAPGPLKCPLFGLTVALGWQVVCCLLAAGGWFVPDLLRALLGGLYVTLGFLMGQWSVGPFVPGAVDNASGVAALLALVARWQSQSVEGVELVALLSGSEESGCLGSAAWLDRHADQLRATPTCFLNLDTLGCGRPRFLAGECMLGGPVLRYPAELLEGCGHLAERLGLQHAGPHWLPIQTDGLAFLARNIPGLTITSFQEDGWVPHYHQLSDRADAIQFEVTVQATEFAWELLHALAVSCRLVREPRCGGDELPDWDQLDLAFAESEPGVRLSRVRSII